MGAMPVPAWAQSGFALVVFLFVVVFLRSQATYWLARALPALVEKASGRWAFLQPLANWAQGPIPQKGARILDKWGIIIIPLSFLTVGVQTAVLAGAGLVKMNWGKFALASIPGCIAWAIVYGLGLLALWVAAVRAAAGSGWAWAGLAIILVLAALGILAKTKRGGTTKAQ